MPDDAKDKLCVVDWILPLGWCECGQQLHVANFEEHNEGKDCQYGKADPYEWVLDGR